MLLLNAISFDANWAHPFPEERTADRPFARENDGGGDVPMMFREETHPYLKGDDFQAVKLPYAGEAASMVVFVPNEGVPLDDWAKTLDADRWNEYMNGFAPKHGLVGLPKFRMEKEIPLNALLSRLGMGAVRDPAAAS